MNILRMPLLDEKREPGPHKPATCPVCGEWWAPPGLSRLNCHGRCLIVEEVQDQWFSGIDGPGKLIARYEHLGITRSIVLASLKAARKRRERRERERGPLRQDDNGDWWDAAGRLFRGLVDEG